MDRSTNCTAENIMAPAVPTSPIPEIDDQWTSRARFLFIVGAPRSGTTWLQAMLASHPAVATGPETQFFKVMSAIDSSFSQKLPRAVGLSQYLSSDEFYSIMTNLFHRVAGKLQPPHGPIIYFLEKTPEHALYVPFILRCLPDARFIHILRDARHVVASLCRVQSRWGKPDATCSATYGAQVWRQCVEAARRIPNFLPKRDHYHQIRYEDLRQSPKEILAQLFSWLELPADDRAIEELVAANELESARINKKFGSIPYPLENKSHTGPEEPEGFFGKASIDRNCSGLTRLQEYQCYRECGDLLYEFGYCPRKPSVPWWATIACSWTVRALLRLGPI